MSDLDKYHSDLSKTGAIRMVDEKIANQVSECTGRYLKIDEFWKQISIWLISFLTFYVISTGGIFVFLYNGPSKEIRSLSEKMIEIKTDLKHIKDKLK